MASKILIFGDTGSGKTGAGQYLDPDTTIWIDADGKGLSFTGWKAKYSLEKKNLVKTKDIEFIKTILLSANDPKHPTYKVKSILIDTVNGIMIEKEKAINYGSKGNGVRSQYLDLAMEILEIIELPDNLRDDLTVFFIGHIALVENVATGEIEKRLLTNGRKLEKLVLESKFTTVLLATVNRNADGKNEFKFETQKNKSTAKSPDGLFSEFLIEPNYEKIRVRLLEYENGIAPVAVEKPKEQEKTAPVETTTAEVKSEEGW